MSEINLNAVYLSKVGLVVGNFTDKMESLESQQMYPTDIINGSETPDVVWKIEHPIIVVMQNDKLMMMDLLVAVDEQYVYVRRSELVFPQLFTPTRDIVDRWMKAFGPSEEEIGIDLVTSPAND